VKAQRQKRDRPGKTDEICDAAMALIASDGPHALTMQRLARSLNRAVGGVYRYFPSKDALLAELQLRTIQEYGRNRDAMLKRARTAGITDERLVHVIAKHYQRWMLDRPGHFGLLTTALAFPRPLLPDLDGQRVMAGVLPVLQSVTQLFADLNGRPFVEGDPVERTLVFWCALQGVVQSAKISRFQPELMNNDRLVRGVVHALLVGWGVKNSDELHIQLKETETWGLANWRPQR
jgi:AcrR family transcriptional regulator